MNSNKVAIVTGSTHGIGKAIALELAKIGFKLIINGASTPELPESYHDQLKEIYGIDSKENYMYIRADVSDKDSRKNLIESVKDKFGRIDVLINNAGVAPKERKDILESSEESFEWVVRVNLQGPYFLSQTVANWMIELKKSLSGEYEPYIINISSISSFASSPNRGEYCISKAGMTMMTKLFADRLSEFNIQVFEIQPGIIKTSMTERVTEKYDKLIEEGLTPIKRWGVPEDVAKAVSAIVCGKLPFSTGEVLHVDGGFHLYRL